MSFRLFNGLASFQGFFNKILAKKLDIFDIVYLNDILSHTKYPGQDHVNAVCWVLEQLRKYDFYAKLKSCYFHQDEIWFLGFVVSAKGI